MGYNEAMERPTTYMLPTQQQAVILEDPRRVIIAAAGRRWGKATTLGALALFNGAMSRPGKYMAILPSNGMARLFWERCRELFPVTESSALFFAFRFANGSEIRCFSEWSVPDSSFFVGSRINGIFVKEPWLLKDRRLLAVALRPRLEGWFLAAGTPPPRRAVKRLRLVLRIAAKRAGLDPESVGIYTHRSGIIDPSFIEEARASMSPAGFEAEYLQQFS
jgi:hypothetical protein